MQDLEAALLSQTPLMPDQHLHSGQHELPPLHIDGIPTPVDKMTQVGDLGHLNINLCTLNSSASQNHAFNFVNHQLMVTLNSCNREF